MSQPLSFPPNPLEPENYQWLLSQTKAELAQMSQDHERTILEQDQKFVEKMNKQSAEIENLKKHIADMKTADGQASQKKIAHEKYRNLIIFLILFEVIISLIILSYGDGENTFQKLMNSWEFLVSGFPATLLIGAFYLKKEELRLLGWPYNKLFGGE